MYYILNLGKGKGFDAHLQTLSSECKIMDAYGALAPARIQDEPNLKVQLVSLVRLS